jgi:hypothetical protein
VLRKIKDLTSYMSMKCFLNSFNIKLLYLLHIFSAENNVDENKNIDKKSWT